MDAFGRTIVVSLGAIGLVFSLLFYKTASVRWQKAETVRNMCQAYAEQVLSDKEICCSEWEAFRNQLERLGNYRAEFAVYERRRYEGMNGRIYLLREWEVSGEDMLLTEGSYIRITVTEEEHNKMQTFFYGSGCVAVAGGRVG